MAEEWLAQVLVNGTWSDYARTTEALARAWQAERPQTRRVVDWIDKHRVIIPAA